MLVESVPPSEAGLLEVQRVASLELAAPRLEGYEIIELIGEGTYGEVWLARETQTSVIVAIRATSAISRTRSVAQEVEHLARLSAVRGIVALRKVHLHAEPYCYVMEHMPGGTLADLMRREGASKLPGVVADVPSACRGAVLRPPRRHRPRRYQTG